MPLDIVLEDENGKFILSINDSQGSLSQLVKYCSERINEFRVMKYIDLYGDTTFNTLMIKDLLIDLHQIAGEFPSMNEHKTALERVGDLRKIESRANFVSTKMQSDDQTVATTDRSGGPATLNGLQFRLSLT